MEFVVWNPDWEQYLAGDMHEGLDALREAMEEIAHENCPVKTGFLDSTIFSDIDPETGVITLGATAYYASIVEQRVPFLRPAVYQAFGDLGEMVSQ